ncbi:right-handed parallel beta-helix repeat-containing protein, partial [bacterium]|nr:right-handed parallel beta-helix repeat-containing protein [candidate division CSSED10-310 bacterium]
MKSVRFCLRAAMVVCSFAVCHSAVIHVPADQPTIQAGLNAAEPGDIVLVAEGTFHENIVWPATPDITLRGNGLPESVVLDGKREWRVILILNDASDPVRIESVTIRGGSGSLKGGGVYASGADIIMKNCIITDNWVPGPILNAKGGGIFAELNVLHLYNCTVSNNQVADDTVYSDENKGGGIYADHLVAVNCLITENTVHGFYAYGAGVFSSYADIVNCVITGNYSATFGGVCHYDGSIRNSTICDNYWSDIGALYGSCRMTVDSSIIGGAGFASPSGSILELNYTCYESAAASVVIGPGSFNADPMFAAGPDGDYYLSNTATGQASTSPCVDTGNPSVSPSGSDSTRTDYVPDTGIIDMGYHYDCHAPANTPTPVPTVTPTETPTPSPTPECNQTGVSILVEPASIDPGDTITVMLELCNASAEALGPVRLYLALDVYGLLFFWPSWSSDYDFEATTLDPGRTQMPIFD